ncbi:MAG: hypothetical protein IT384_27200 [Deltaproteobacteria bacterium]|nr:hypothetical protein [Deltaproteobacteria bacterium]
MSPSRAIALSAAAVAFLAGLAVALMPGEEDDPEGAIRAVLAAAASAAEAGDLDGILEHVSDSFQSADGKKDDLKRVIFFELRRRSWRKVFLVKTEVDLRDEARAKVTTGAILARGEAPQSIAELNPTEVTAYRFELDFALEDGRWRITSAAWRRAGFDELVMR